MFKAITMNNLSTASHALQFLVGCAAILASVSPTKALGLTYTNSTSFQSLDFADTPLDIQQFDNSLGTLNSVDLIFTANMISDVSLENLSFQATTVIVDLYIQTELKLDNQILVSSGLGQIYTYQVASYDGLIDFAGASGRSMTGLTATLSNTQTLNNNLQAFIGSGNVSFLVSSIGISSMRARGNVIGMISPSTQGIVQVTYNYDPINSTQAVPFDIPGGPTFPVAGFLLTLGLARKTRKFIVNK
ncbi:choice-of-anchor E domain-containing protein [Anabaena azotica]|uniref:choice-of-anchor E domain-containing protein n=1 Tax=Anabaena azotica TaxID=197653 RepID=UPI0039A57CA3